MKFKGTNVLDKIAISFTLASVPIAAHSQSASPTFLEENREAVAVLIFIYILPGLIAYWRKHPSKASIIIVDILFGWTAIGWIWALIWACGKTTQPVMIVSTVNGDANAKIAPAANSAASKTIAERIADLKAMLDSGALTQAEFDLLKADVLKKGT